MFRTTATNEHGKKEEIGVSAVFVDPRRRVFALCTVRHEGVSKWSSPPEVCSAARLLLCTDAVKIITGPKAPPVALELQIVREYIQQAGGKKDYHRESKFFDQFWKWHTGGRTKRRLDEAFTTPSPSTSTSKKSSSKQGALVPTTAGERLSASKQVPPTVERPSASKEGALVPTTGSPAKLSGFSLSEFSSSLVTNLSTAVSGLFDQRTGVGEDRQHRAFQENLGRVAKQNQAEMDRVAKRNQLDMDRAVAAHEKITLQSSNQITQLTEAADRSRVQTENERERAAKDLAKERENRDNERARMTDAVKQERDNRDNEREKTSDASKKERDDHEKEREKERERSEKIQERYTQFMMASLMSQQQFQHNLLGSIMYHPGTAPADPSYQRHLQHGNAFVHATPAAPAADQHQLLLQAPAAPAADQSQLLLQAPATLAAPAAPTASSAAAPAIAMSTATPATLANAKMEKLMVKLATWLDDNCVGYDADVLKLLVGEQIGEGDDLLMFDEKEWTEFGFKGFALKKLAKLKREQK